jgi:hypothetical protein
MNGRPIDSIEGCHSRLLLLHRRDGAEDSLASEVTEDGRAVEQVRRLYAERLHVNCRERTRQQTAQQTAKRCQPCTRVVDVCVAWTMIRASSAVDRADARGVIRSCGRR